MNSRTSTLVRRSWAQLLLASTVGFVSARPASAQTCSVPTDNALDPSCVDDVGYPVCFQHPFDPPGALAGLPVWPDTRGAFQSIDTPSSNTTTIRDEASDPRWSGSPLRSLFSDRVNSVNDRVKYRLVTSADNTELAVSIQIESVPAMPKSSDFVYFGLAEHQGDTVNGKAEGIRIALSSLGLSPGTHLPLPASAVTYYTTPGGSAAWVPARATIPDWLVKRGDGTPLISEWVNVVPSGSTQAEIKSAQDEASLDGAVLVVAFKVKLNTAAFNFTGQAAKIMVGAEVDIGGQGPARWFTPNVDLCAGATGCQLGENVDINGETLDWANPFLKATAQWTPVDLIGSACQGINFVRTDISTPLTCGPNNSVSNCVTAAPGGANTFNFTPDIKDWWTNKAASLPSGQTFDLPSDWIRATFRMSNWGSVADPAQWITIAQKKNDALSPPTGMSLPPDAQLEEFDLGSGCTNANSGVQNVCSKSINTKDIIPPISNSFHQCMLVELSASPAGTAGGVRIGTAAKYINTAFQEASAVDRVAQINIKGVVDAVPGQTRDVYLHVDARNMPEHGSAPVETMDVPGLKALRGQIDPGFSEPGTTCGITQKCYAPSGNSGLCVYPYVPSGNGEFQCQTVTIDGEEYCAPGESSPACVKPAKGGYDPNTSSLTGPQMLAAAFPTVMVYPYYDSGSTVMVEGVQKKRLIPMQSFGVHSYHEGSYYGWSHSLTDESGNMLPEVSPNVFKIAVDAATGLANVGVHLEAHTEPRADTLFEIAGTATPLSLALGNATITGVAATRSLDLSRSTVTIQKLLYNDGKELVTSMKRPITLYRQFGATKTSASYSAWGFPSITMQVNTLPLIGQVITIQVFLADVQAPSACGLLFGTAPITTSFSISDGNGAAAVVTGTDTWTCVPGQLLNF